MKIDQHPKFIKNYKKRIKNNKNLENKVAERVRLFMQDLRNPVLQNHKLVGKMKQYKSFSITGDIRLVYRIINEETVLFYDIGTHNQVYK